MNKNPESKLYKVLLLGIFGGIANCTKQSEPGEPPNFFSKRTHHFNRFLVTF